MSKLSPSLKALINAPFARPGQTPAPRRINDVFTRIAHEARERQYGERPWLTLAVSLVSHRKPPKPPSTHAILPISRQQQPSRSTHPPRCSRCTP
jgi:hypothetical protein